MINQLLISSKIGSSNCASLYSQIFILIEHPVERDKLETLQELLLTERSNFLGLVYNLTSQIDPSTITGDALDELYSAETIKTMLLSTNQFRPHWNRQEFYSLETMVIFSDILSVCGSEICWRYLEVIYPTSFKVRKVDQALLDYERTVAVAASEGINVTNKECVYKWTYVQSVFFTSTVITTVGEQKIRDFQKPKWFFFGKCTFSREKNALFEPRKMAPGKKVGKRKCHTNFFHQVLIGRGGKKFTAVSFCRLWQYCSRDDRRPRVLHPLRHHRDPLHLERDCGRRPDHCHPRVNHMGKGKAFNRALGRQNQVRKIISQKKWIQKN